MKEFNRREFLGFAAAGGLALAECGKGLEEKVKRDKESKEILTSSYANNQGVRIYYEVEGNGLPLVLQHGWSNSIGYWRDFGYVKELKNDYRLILIDARGHGNSDIPDDPKAYDTKLMAEDVVVVLDDIGIDKAHFLGYSMGGWIGFHLAEDAPHRFLSLIIGGAHPYAENLAFLQEFIVNDGMKGVLDLWDEVSAPLSQELRRRLLEHDTKPLLASVAEDRLDMSNVLSAMKMPCLIYLGEEDNRYAGAKECVRHIPNGTFVSLPGLDHLEAYIRSDLVLPHITKFLSDVSRM